MHLKQWGVAFGICVWSLLASAVTNESASSQKAECIGRYEITLPSEVEFGLVSIDDIVNDKGVNGHSLYYFDNGESTSYGWGYEVSQSLSKEEFAKFKERIRAKIKKNYDRYMKKAQNASSLLLKELFEKDASFWVEKNTGIEDSYAYGGLGTRLYLYRNGKIYTVDAKDDATLQTKLANFRVRSPYEIPKETGLCYPYGFEVDNGHRKYSMSVVMRLRDRPEVEILFQIGGAVTSKDKSAADEISFFWEYNYREPDRERKLISPHVPGIIYFPRVEIDKRKGKYSLVRITRENGMIDYGYMAYVQKDYQAKEYTPDLTMYVISTNARAKSKPLEKNEFSKMAEDIAASIRLRPVQ